jgi:hypothetical protein
MKPHRMDGVSFSFGLIFLTGAAWWLIARVLTVSLPNAGWLVAGALILFGVLGLLGAIRSGRHAEAPTPAPVEPAPEIPGDLPPEMHASIVEELLDDPAERFAREQPHEAREQPHD